MPLNFNQALQLPGDHIAFVFSDTAGANACIAFAKICEKEKKAVVIPIANKLNFFMLNVCCVYDCLALHQGEDAVVHHNREEGSSILRRC